MRISADSEGWEVTTMESKSTGRNLGGEPLHGLRERSSSFVVAVVCLVSLSGVARAQCPPPSFNCAGNNALCNDGLFCTLDFCSITNTCYCTTPNSCNDSLFCTVDSCNEVTNACEHTPTNCQAPQFCSEVFGG